MNGPVTTGAEDFAIDSVPQAHPLMPADAFAHVPALAGKIIDPASSRLRLSRASFQEWDDRARAAGYPANWRRSHEEREATRYKALHGRLDQDLWLFAYGSLMWDPAIHVVEIRTATLEGLHRRFCLRIELGRGSKDRPGLMAALDQGGQCHGLAFRIPAHVVDRETEILWMREMISEAYLPVFRSVATPQGPIEALAFAIDRQSPRYADLSVEQVAGMVATGAGLLGTNREYFDNLATHLALLGIEDNLCDAIRQRLSREAPAPQPP